MTGFNHATTGALIAVLAKDPVIAIPLAFVSHFVMDAIPHFGWNFDQDVFERNRTKQFKIAAALETPLSIVVLIVLPVIMQPIVPWLVTLTAMIAALFMDLIWLYRGVREELTKKVKPRNWIMDFHLRISHHHQRFIIDVFFELVYFAVALTLILQPVK